MSDKGLLVVLSGPSGAGKDTVLNNLLAKNKNIRIIMYILSASFILGFPMINGANEYIQGVDSNTWLLLSLSVTFLANYIGVVSSKKIELEKKEKELNQRIEN